MLIEDELHSACLTGNLKKVKRLIKLDFDVHYAGDCLLRAACSKNNLEIVKCLIEKGANVRANRDESLMLASYHGNLQMVKLLIKNEADFMDPRVIVTASSTGNIELVKYLVEMGANVNAKRGSWRLQTDKSEAVHPVSVACEFNHTEVIKYLINNGASIDLAIVWAIHCENIKLIKYLLIIGANTYNARVYARIYDKTHRGRECIDKLIDKSEKMYLLFLLIDKRKVVHKGLIGLLIGKAFQIW